MFFFSIFFFRVVRERGGSRRKTAGDEGTRRGRVPLACEQKPKYWETARRPRFDSLIDRPYTSTSIIIRSWTALTRTRSPGVIV